MLCKIARPVVPIRRLAPTTATDSGANTRRKLATSAPRSRTAAVTAAVSPGVAGRISAVVPSASRAYALVVKAVDRVFVAFIRRASFVGPSWPSSPRTGTRPVPVNGRLTAGRPALEFGQEVPTAPSGPGPSSEGAVRCRVDAGPAD